LVKQIRDELEKTMGRYRVIENQEPRIKNQDEKSQKEESQEPRVKN